MKLPAAVRDAFARQAEACRKLGSPFTAHLCDRLPELLDGSTALGRSVATWPLDPVESALALRLCGALHRLVRTGRAPGLARLYPPAKDTGPALDAALTQLFERQSDDLLPLIDSAPQTNEVARSAILLGGLLTIARETRLPLALFEIGSSAGLNLHPDCYAYDLGDGRRWGPPEAPVMIASDWRGICPPLDAPLRIVSRAGCDLAPVNAADCPARERVLSYIWPDQLDRLARTEAALTHAAAHPVTLDTADAADWVEAHLAAAKPGIVRVLLHSIAWQYFSAATQRRILTALAAAGPTATQDAPLAWLRLEPDGVRGPAAVQLTLWPGGESRMLGRADYHGRFADWRTP